MPLVTVEKYLDQNEQVLHADFKEMNMSQKFIIQTKK